MEPVERCLVELDIPEEYKQLKAWKAGVTYKLKIKARDQRLFYSLDLQASMQNKFFREFVVFVCSENLKFSPGAIRLIRQADDSLPEAWVEFVLHDETQGSAIEIFCDIMVLPEFELLQIVSFCLPTRPSELA